MMKMRPIWWIRDGGSAGGGGDDNNEEEEIEVTFDSNSKIKEEGEVKGLKTVS